VAQSTPRGGHHTRRLLASAVQHGCEAPGKVIADGGVLERRKIDLDVGCSATARSLAALTLVLPIARSASSMTWAPAWANASGVNAASLVAV
jgi:hypothetical protein